MSTMRTNAAAVMLGVSPNTLRSWERRFGFPTPRRTAGGHRQYDLVEVEALRQALEDTHNISSAVSIARERGEGPSTSARLRAAFARFDEEKADRLLEDSLAVRSVERTVEELLLPAVESLRGEGPAGPELHFAWRRAAGWLAAAQRLAPPATRPEGVLVVDAARTYDADALYVAALELALRRGGLRTLTVDVEVDPIHLKRALRALCPAAVVLTGRRASMDVLGRLVYAVRQSVPEVEVFDYRDAIPDTGASTICRLGTSPAGARQVLLERLTGLEITRSAPVPAHGAERPARALRGA
ncbi:MAG: MerR family transcriptional regulator [Solirubrobacteraceae bacterium]